jgi:glycosyltransferase involved in cell wall biosynthesis
MSKRFFYSFVNPKSGCDIHRIIYPIRHIEPYFKEQHFDLSLTDPHYPYYYYCTHGAPPIGNFAHIGQWKLGGGKWILSLDDDFFSVPDWNPAKLSDEQLWTYRSALDLADVIWSSTLHLTKTLGYEHKTLTAPNMLQVEDYKVTEPVDYNSGEILRIMWSGSKSHRLDLQEVEYAMDRLLEEYQGKIEFICVGDAPNEIVKKWLYRGLHFEAGVPFSIYPQLVNKIRPHVVLAPLADCPFNYSKSNIRVLEGWSVAAAVVASPVGEYRVIKDGEDGLLATTQADWYLAIKQLIDNEPLRKKLAYAGRKRVGAEWNWNNPACHGQWIELVNELGKRA